MDLIGRMILFTAVAAVLIPVYWLLRFCIRVGARRAVRDIVRGFRQEVDENKGDLELDDEVELKRLSKDHSGWYTLEGESSFAQHEITEIGRLLGRIGYISGEQWAREQLQSTTDEAQVRLKREDLKRISWLADVGFRIYTHPGYEGVRMGERLSEQDAQQMASLLDAFDRAAAVPWPDETDYDTEERFESHFNRQKDLASSYHSGGSQFRWVPDKPPTLFPIGRADQGHP